VGVPTESGGTVDEAWAEVARVVGRRGIREGDVTGNGRSDGMRSE
jgi:hypothetical protein